MDESAFYDLKFQARTISAVLGQTDYHQFLVGTVSPKEENEVRCLTFDEDDNQIVCQAVYRHPEQVWSICTSPTDESRFFTISRSLSGDRIRLFQAAVVDEPSEEVSELEQLLELKGHSSPITGIVWNPDEASRVISLEEAGFKLWDLENSDSKEAHRVPIEDGPLQAGCWNPHHIDNAVLAHGTSFSCWDLRSAQSSQIVKQAHSDLIRSIDYNPNKPHHIVTSSDDRLIRCWDVRHSAHPLRTLQAHSHWVWGVQYNRFHDQLVLSSGTDGGVNLWRVVTISSAPLGDLEDHQNEKEGDNLIMGFKSHEESVYGMSWSACDAWIFATVSFDGRVAVNHVPSTEKYKILL